MKMKRREFLRTSVAGAGSLLAGPGLMLGGEKKLSGHCDPYKVCKLGKTTIKMTRLGLGTGMRGGGRASNHTRMGQENFTKLVNACWDRGVRWFDVADLYGTHPFLANALKDKKRKDYVVASKIWWRRGGIPEKERPNADIVIDRFCKELKTDYVDIVLLHCVVSDKWPEELAEQMNIMAGLKKKGIIRAHGVSCHTLGALKAAAEEPWVDSVHARINPFGVKMDGPAEQVAPVLQKMHESGKGVVGMKIVGEGTFGDSGEKKDQSVNYVLNLGCVDVMTVGFEKIWQIDDLAKRIEKVPAKA